MKTAAIYTRVSSPRQAKLGYGLEIQLGECKAYAAAHGFEVAPEHIFVEPGESGKTNNRPEFNKVKKMAGKIDAVILWVHSRFSRADDVMQTLNLLSDIEKAGTQIHTTSRGQVTTLTLEGLLLSVIDLHQAKREHTELIEKTRKGHRLSRQHGNVGPTQKRYGYRYVSKQANGGKQKLERIEAEAQIVQDIYTWFAVAGPDGEKMSPIGIANELTARKIPTAKDGTTGKLKGLGVWTESTVRQILKNPLYKGVLVYGKTRVEYHEDEYGDRVERRLPCPENEWIFVNGQPSCVSEALWNAAQAQFEAIPARRRKNGKYLLRGLIKCSRCGLLLTGETHADATYVYYRCGGTCKRNAYDRETLSCHGAFSTTTLDTLVWEHVKAFVLHPENLRKGEGTKSKGYRAKMVALRKRQGKLLEDIAGKQQEYDACNDMYQMRRITREDWLNRTGDLDSAIAVLSADYDKISRELEDSALSEESWRGVEDFCKRMAEGIEYLNEDEKRRVLEVFEITGEVDRDQNVLILRGLIPDVALDLPELRQRQAFRVSSLSRSGRESYTNYPFTLVIPLPDKSKKAA